MRSGKSRFSVFGSLAGYGPRVAPEPPWPDPAVTAKASLESVGPEPHEFSLPAKHAHHRPGVMSLGDAFVGRAGHVVPVGRLFFVRFPIEHVMRLELRQLVGGIGPARPGGEIGRASC